MTKVSETASRELVITRLLKAPRELVYEAWTHPQHIMHWWGPNGFTNTIHEIDVRPNGFTNTIHEMDVRPNGVWRFIMHGPDGADYPNKIVFLEVVRPERLVYLHSDDVENGGKSFEVTVTFEAQGSQTELTMRILFKTKEERDSVVEKSGAIEGSRQTINRLEVYLTGIEKEPIIVERTFNAPAEKVWKAISDKDEMKKWYFDVPQFKAEVGCEFEFYGGTEEKQFLHLCKVTEVAAGKKLAYTWRYDGYEGNSLVTFELFSEGNKTKVKLTHTGLHTFTQIPELARGNFVAGWNDIIHQLLEDFLGR